MYHRSLKFAFLLLTTFAFHCFGIDPQVEAVVRIVEGAKGRVEKTADGQSLTLVDLQVAGMGPHDHRREDPYDAAFFEQLGQISSLETLNIILTKFNDAWIPAISKLTNLKSLRIFNNGPLTDAGMEQLSGLKNLEYFSFVGTRMTGRAYAKFDGFNKLKTVFHRGSSVDDEGLKQMSEHLPQIESIGIVHCKCTDAGVVHLTKLGQLKRLELGSRNATAASLKTVAALPLEYLRLSDGLDTHEGVEALQGVSTLKHLALESAKVDEALLRLTAGFKQLEKFEVRTPVPEELLPLWAPFTFLKQLKLINTPKGYSPEFQENLKKLLPQTELVFN
jgi:hypothetical protein